MARRHGLSRALWKDRRKKLELLLRASPNERKILLRDNKMLHCVCKCFLDIAKGKAGLTVQQHRKLVPLKSGLVKLHRAKTTAGKRKVLTGGFLGALLSSAIPIIGNLLGGLMGRR